MSVINTNYLALVSQNNLTKSQNSLGTAIERLSSGLRINSAKDDAAGQAIANRFTANVNGLTQAARNANDGISIAQTTEGALNEINENLQRIRTLTVDAATGTKSKSDLASIQNEIQERLDEINRVSEQTQFNGVKVLGSDATTLNIQVGAHDGQQIAINLSEISAETLKIQDFDVAKAFGTSFTNVSKVDEQVDIGALTGITIGNATGGTIGSNVTKGDDGNYYVEVTGAADSDHDGFYQIDIAKDGSVTAKALDVADVKTTAEVGGSVVTTVPTGKKVDVDMSALTLSGDAAGGKATLVHDKESDKYYVRVADATNADGNGYYEAEVANDGKVTVAAWTKATPAGAPEGSNATPLEALDKALQQVDDLRSHLGAIQNRFQSTIANLNNTVNNLSAARSRIEDADYALEVSNMTRSQILQQAGTSVLAQANQVPQTVLSLLR
ncbi:FliC/FljB family flagellin [Alcaligenes faecalis]|uniref:Flagellin n=1 Tax=Alcaligenes faecalis TaxID=511 RepID=A0AB33CZM4_ALCFA|nr:FliC/FljB family flagellin [Alcaligenes faecalis]ASR89037.1 flagellin FliC [Alcaligenes faecalis]